MSMIDRAARAWLKVEYYDPEPEMYDDIEGFWDGHKEWWTMAGMWDARDNARAAIAAAFDTTDDELFEGMQTAVEAAIKEDVGDTGLAVTRAVFGFIQAQSKASKHSVAESE